MMLTKSQLDTMPDAEIRRHGGTVLYVKNSQGRVTRIKSNTAMRGPYTPNIKADGYIYRLNNAEAENDTTP
jgi:hypothetical protein